MLFQKRVDVQYLSNIILYKVVNFFLQSELLSSMYISLEKELVLRRSIKVRNPYVDPLNYIQVALLQRLTETQDGATAQQLRAAVLLSVNGIAAGLQNTG